MTEDGEFESVEEEYKACHELLDKHGVETEHLIAGEPLSLFGRVSLLVGDLDFGNGRMTTCPECHQVFEVKGLTKPVA